MTHTLTIYRDRYTVEDDGHGGSEAVPTETITEGQALTRDAGSFDNDDGRVVRWAETPVRQAVGILYREYLRMDGASWFEREPSTIDYATGEEERVTGHLDGFTDAETRAVIRMLAWLDARDAARTAEYLSRGVR